MTDMKKWTLEVERSLYNELKHMSFDEGQSLNEFCHSAIIVFRNELVKLRDDVSAQRQKQLEYARLAAENPLQVTGIPTEPIGEVIEHQAY